VRREGKGGAGWAGFPGAGPARTDVEARKGELDGREGARIGGTPPRKKRKGTEGGKGWTDLEGGGNEGGRDAESGGCHERHRKERPVEARGEEKRGMQWCIGRGGGAPGGVVRLGGEGVGGGARGRAREKGFESFCKRPSGFDPHRGADSFKNQ